MAMAALDSHRDRIAAVVMSRLANWINCNAAGIQAVSAVVVALLTGFLVFLTRRYVRRTGEAIALSRDQLTEYRASLQLMREQVEHDKQSLKLAKEAFEREWQPQLRVFVHNPSINDARLEMVNLGRAAVHIESIEFGVGIGTSLRTDRMEWVRHVPVNESADLNISAYLLKVIAQQLGLDTAQPYDGNMAVRVEFFSAGSLHKSQWFYFGAVVRDGVVRNISPMLGS
jgi:hypothetical protein